MQKDLPEVSPEPERLPTLVTLVLGIGFLASGLGAIIFLVASVLLVLPGSSASGWMIGLGLGLMLAGLAALPVFTAVAWAAVLWIARHERPIPTAFRGVFSYVSVAGRIISAAM